MVLEEKEGMPGQYEARFFLRPHYQLEGHEHRPAAGVAPALAIAR